MRTAVVGFVVLAVALLGATLAAQPSEPTAAPETCASLGGTCMEGCEAGYQDVGAHDCTDSTCCVLAGVDQSDPSSVVAAVFTAALTGQFAALGGLCDPAGEADGDVLSICALATDASGAAEFVEYFRAGRVNGEPTIEGDTAAVPILFGPDGSRSETMELVKRGELWYLQSF